MSAHPIGTTERDLLEQALDARRAALATSPGSLSEEVALSRLVPSSTTPLGLGHADILVEQQTARRLVP